MIAVVLATGFLAGAPLGLAAEKKSKFAKPYPMEVCVVSAEKLGSMGEPFVIEYEGQQVKFCCKNCQKDFDKDPKKYLAKINEAAKKVKPYPAKTCVVSGEPLEDDAPASIFKGQEFKFCCQNCQKKFDKEPAKFAAKLPKS
jgi:YHS domain-containing protein